jgi:hypothetical protein
MLQTASESHEERSKRLFLEAMRIAKQIEDEEIMLGLAAPIQDITDGEIFIDRSRHPPSLALHTTTLNVSLNFNVSVVRPVHVNNNITSLLDEMMQNRLPRVYPSRFGIKLVHASDEIVHAQWKQPAVRRYGVGPDTVAKEAGGSTVKGDWPDLITGLAYLPITKNGHTTLANAVGDLRQRIQDCIVTTYRVAFDTCTRVDKLLENTPIIFTVLRDPIERFISATCEDLRLDNTIVREKCFANDDIDDSVRCIVQQLKAENVLGRDTMTHQEPQYVQLFRVMANVDRPVFVVSFDQLSQLLGELGNGSSEKDRDRRKMEYFLGGTAAGHTYMKRLANFCRLNGQDLKQEHVEHICHVYRLDIALMASLGLRASFCR